MKILPLKESYSQVITDGVHELPIEKELDEFLNDYPYLFVKIDTYSNNKYQLIFFYKTIDGRELEIWESHLLDKDFLPVSIKYIIDKNYKNNLSIKRDLEKRNSKLRESLENKTLYHLSKVELIDGKPWVNKQGAHFAENIDTCNYLQSVRNYDNPHFYKFNIIKELNPLYIESDAIYWDAKNLSRKLINKKYVNIDFTDQEKSRLKYFISLPNGKSTKENELEIYQMLLNRGYNCVAYRNTQEPGTGYSILLFDTSFIDKGIPVDKDGNELTRLDEASNFNPIQNNNFKKWWNDLLKPLKKKYELDISPKSIKECGLKIGHENFNKTDTVWYSFYFVHESTRSSDYITVYNKDGKLGKFNSPAEVINKISDEMDSSKSSYDKDEDKKQRFDDKVKSEARSSGIDLSKLPQEYVEVYKKIISPFKHNLPQDETEWDKPIKDFLDAILSSEEEKAEQSVQKLQKETEEKEKLIKKFRFRLKKTAEASGIDYKEYPDIYDSIIKDFEKDLPEDQDEWDYKIDEFIDEVKKFTKKKEIRSKILARENLIDEYDDDYYDEKPLQEVYPNKGESKKDFISRFMSVTKDEYPDIKQRYAVANSYWDRRNKK